MKTHFIHILLFMLLVALAGCSKRNKEILIGISQCSQDEWREKQNFEMKREATFYENVHLEVRSVKDDNEKQIKDIQYFIDHNADLIIVSPNEAKAVTPIVEKAFDKGIPVIVIDRKITSDKYTAFIAADNKEIGQSVGEFLNSTVHKPQKLFEISGLAGSTPASERHEGLTETIKDNPLITYIGYKDAGWNMPQAERVMDSIMKVHPDIDILVAQNDRMAIGAHKIAKRYNKEKSIIFIGVDALTTKGWGVENVMQGNLTATFIYPTGGDKIIQTAMNILNKGKFQRETILSTALVDHTNARIMMLQDEQIIDQDNKIKILSNKIDNYLNRHNTQQLLLISSIVILVLLIAISAIAIHAYWTKVRTNQLLTQHNEEISKQRDLLQQQKDKMTELTHQVEEATHAKLQFFTNVSHDLRTPLTLIADPLEHIIKEGAQNETQRKFLPIINKNVNILLKLVNQVLDFRKYENGKLSLSLSSFNLPQMLSEWNKAFTGSALKRHIKMNLILPEIVEVTMDSEKIERIYFNIVSNAMKYTPDNGSITTILSTFIIDEMPYISLKVSDNGSGIEAEHIKSIFDRFYQVDTHHSGSGIGLALVKAFVELHGGTIGVENNQDKGTSFIITMPQKAGQGILKQDDTDVDNTIAITSGLISETEQIEDIYNDEQISQSAQATILIVDDNADVCHYVATMMQDEYRCVCAYDGKQGVAKAMRYIPDVVISDIMMPVMDGIQLTQKLKSDIQTSHIPIILLTACALDEQRIEGFKEGADSYISKPFNIDILKARIENLLDNRKRLRSLFQADKKVIDDKKWDNEKSFIQKFYSIIDERMQESELSIDDIGNELGMGRTQLYRKIKALTNFSPVELLRSRRLKSARTLLSGSEKSISEIAYQVGFSSPSYFTKCFKDEFGESPNEIIKKRV